MEILYSFKIDILEKLEYPKMEFVQGDTVNKLKISITKNKEVFDLADKIVRLVFLKSDGKVVVSDDKNIIIDGNSIEYRLGTQEVARAGKVKVALEIYEGLDRVTTQEFEFNVRQQINTDNVVKSSTEYGILQTKISEVNSLIENEQDRIDEVSTIKSDLQTITDNANQATISANDASERANSIANVVENAMVELDGSIVVGNQLKSDLDKDIYDGNILKGELENNIASGTSLNSKLDSATITINNSIEEAIKKDSTLNKTILLSESETLALQESISTANVVNDVLNGNIELGVSKVQEIDNKIDETNTVIQNAVDSTNLAKTKASIAIESALNADNKASLAEFNANLAYQRANEASQATINANNAKVSLEALESQVTNSENIRKQQEQLRQQSISNIESSWNNLTTKQQQDAEVVSARGGYASLSARLNGQPKYFWIEEKTVLTGNKTLTLVNSVVNGQRLIMKDKTYGVEWFEGASLQWTRSGQVITFNDAMPQDLVFQIINLG